MTKNVQYINANDLVNAAAEASKAALSSLLASLGVVQIAIHPTSVPQAAPAARTSRATRQAAIMADIYPEVTPEQHAQAARATRPASVAPDVPYCTISDGYRTRLPKGIFMDEDGRPFPYIYIIAPSGTEYKVNTDEEGRSRVPSEWLEGQPGHAALFHAIERGVYQVNVSGQTAARAAVPRSNTTRADVAPPLSDAGLDDIFGPAARTPRRGGRRAAQTQAPAAEDKPKQAGARCPVCGGPGIIGRTVFETATGSGVFTHNKCHSAYVGHKSGVVAAGTREEARAARVTPQMATGREHAPGHPHIPVRRGPRPVQAAPARIAPRAEAHNTAAALRGVTTRNTRG